MKIHCRCRHCRARKKLRKHPLEYRIMPRCSCGARDWLRDEYRHRVELVQMRNKQGRYQPCHADCFHHPHRMGSNNLLPEHGELNCLFNAGGEYR